MEALVGTFDDAVLASSWDAIHANDPHATPFQTRAWLQGWHRMLGEGGQLVVRVFCDAGQAIGAVAEVVAADGSRTLAGGRDVTDYRGPIGAPAHRRAIAKAWVAVLAAEGVSEVDLHGIPTDTGWLDALEAADAELLDRAREDVCPVVSLHGGWEGYLEHVDRHQRREHERKVRRLGREVGPVEVVQAQPGDLEAAVERFLAMAVESAGDKGGFFADPSMRDFFRGIVAEMAPTGVLRLHELVVGGIPAASMVSLVADGEWGLYNSAFDASLEAWGPGSILVWELIRIAAQEECRVFDLLRGDEPYKYRFGARDRVIEHALLRPA